MAPPRAHPVKLGTKLAEMIGKRPVAAIASTDFTHYGDVYQFTPAGRGAQAHEWMRQNDRRLIDRALGLEAEAIVPEARSHHNACGPGALAAAVAYARTRGASHGTLLEHTDSHSVEGSSEESFATAVGYAGIIF